jgi:hypothetical protein
MAGSLAPASSELYSPSVPAPATAATSRRRMDFRSTSAGSPVPRNSPTASPLYSISLEMLISSAVVGRAWASDLARMQLAG